LFRKYGIAGIILILIAQVNFIFKIEPLASWYFPVIWFGYIFTLDAINYKLHRKSLITNNFKKFIFLIILSAAIWWTFEFFNVAVKNWSYFHATGYSEPLWLRRYIFRTLAFGSVLPAIFITFEFFKGIHFLDKFKLNKKHRINKWFLNIMVILGILCILLPLLLPKFTFPLIWLSFFFFLDPINYLHKRPSIISHLKDKRLKIPIALILAGLICGFFWEFWNYWAAVKWSYNIPYVGFFKIFEMPILGYLGYIPFALELYAMYYFIGTLRKEEKKFIFKL